MFIKYLSNQRLQSLNHASVSCPNIIYVCPEQMHSDLPPDLECISYYLMYTRNQIYESCEIHPGCVFSNLAASSVQMSFCKRWPSELLNHSGTQYSLILQPESSFPWLPSPATKPCRIVRLPTSALRAIMARTPSCMILVKVRASRPKPVEQSPGATMFMVTPVFPTGHKAASWRAAHSSTSFVRAYLFQAQVSNILSC